MRRGTWGIVVVAAFAVLAVPVQMTLGAVVGNSPSTPPALDSAGVRRAVAALPVAFEVNRGQVGPAATFVARGSGYAFLVDPLGATLEFSPGASRGWHGARAAAAGAPAIDVMRIDLVGADPHARATAAVPAGATGSFTGDPSRWRTGVPDYARVGFRDVYPGIDVVYHGAGSSLEYDFVVAPGADPRAIRLHVGGAPVLAGGGEVALALAGGTVVQQPPTVYQQAPAPAPRRTAAGPLPARAHPAGSRHRASAPPGSPPLPVPVGSRYVLGGAGELHITVGDYDRTRPLIVDPVVTWSPAAGGGLDDSFVSTMDGGGAVYAVSSTPSPDAATGGAAAGDVAVVKLDAAGRVVYRTVLGGGGDAGPFDLGTDGRGALDITGPATPGTGAAEATVGGERRVLRRLDPGGLPLPPTGGSY